MEMNCLSLLHHQHQTLQLGFRVFLHISYSSRFAVRPSSCNRSLRIGSLLPLTVNAMGSKRALSSSSKPAESPVLRDDDNNKNKKLKATTQNSHGVSAVKVNHQKLQSLEIQSLKDDPSKIEAMTVQELRATLRNAGVPAKGRKNDLVSALKCFVDKQLDDENSEDCSENILLVESATIPDASELKRRKGRVKQPLTNKKTEKVNSEAVMTKVKLSVTSGKVSVGESSQARRKTSSDIQTTVVTPPMAEPWTVLAHKKPQKGWIAYNPTTMRRPPLGSNTKSVKLMSWNVNGLRAMLKVQGFSGLELAHRENFDVLCLQETKLQEKDVESIRECLIDGYENSFWTCSQSKLGYSGTAIISRIKPLSVSYGLGIPDHDIEGRVVTAEFDSFYLLSVYVPNSGDGLKRLSYRIAQWDPSLSDYMKELEKSKPVILTGDLNCAHQEIDIHNPAGNRRSAGFTDEERQSFGENFLSKGFVDTFRNQHPNAVGYTYWGYRHGARKTNKGWRLDYFLVSESIASSVHDSYIVPDVTGSDHCPIGLVLKL